MICPNCHGNIPDNSKFCTLCGSKITPPTSAGNASQSAGFNTGSAAKSVSNPLQKIISIIDFHHFDLRSLVTCEAILWIFPFLMLFFSPVESSFGTSQGLLLEMFESDSLSLPVGMKLFFWVIIILTIVMVVIGFLQIFQPVKNKVIIDYGIAGILVSLFYVLFTTLMSSLLAGMAGFLNTGVSYNLLGNLVRIASWILLAAHSWQIWMMAVQHRRLN